MSEKEQVMSYQQAMAFLDETKKYGSRLGLVTIRRLMGLLGDVQEKVPVIHIAGTNGKGSVGAMLAAIFTAAGYRAGHFSSPDVFCYEEEFQIGGIPIGRKRLAEIFTKVKAGCDEMTARGWDHPTRFEVETAAAFLWFYEEGCDVAVIEAGMGGETDATNLIRRPVLSILTSVSLDHAGFLGETVEVIAKVKAGIIKAGCPAVLLGQKKSVEEIFLARCRKMRSPWILADRSAICEIETVNKRDRAPGLSFSWDPDQNSQALWSIKSRENAEWKTIFLNLAGTFQADNALCVLESLKFLKDKFPNLTEDTVRDGLANVTWPGRFEKIASAPDFYIDGAHNEGAVTALRETLDLYFPGRRILYLMGVLADKDYETMIRRMFVPGDRVFTVTPENPRALDAESLAAILNGYDVEAIPCKSAAEAVKRAKQEALQMDSMNNAMPDAGKELRKKSKGDAGTVLLAFGSLSYLKDVKDSVCHEIYRSIIG